ncbi:MAG: PorP/SprF family type IX secretion system membrane protein [Saprospiraceae bacterium]|nr:PorP/SprF family type IX secretion system membrane protein [Saprospiraceae bacterium]MCB9344611.1 PorP/SprF family type IX secretion system membrane protein [Lewinellaceae bacterium]
MKKLLAVAFLFYCSMVSAQDPIFSQFYAMPLQLNPGFAGSANAPRAGFIYRNQWTGFNSAYRTYAAYYEQSFPRFKSGLGFYAEGDNAGDGIFKTSKFSLAYAYRLPVNDDLAFKIGVEAGLRQTSLDWQKLIFPDQIDALNGISINTEEIQPDATSNSTLDFSTGFLVLSERFYAGFALNHLNTPNESLLLTNDNLYKGLPLRYTIHGGTELVVKEGNKARSSSFISPNFLFVSQGPYKQLNLGAYASLGAIYTGAWFRHTFRNADAVILLAGFKTGFMKVGISYDLTVSGLANHAGGTYEVSLGLLFYKEKRLDINDCTRMFQ